MHFMNEWEVRAAADRYRNDPVLSVATQFLVALMEETDMHSDGWCYWPKPVRAADKLMTLIESGTGTLTDLRRALVPIKTFYTKYGLKAGMCYPRVII